MRLGLRLFFVFSLIFSFTGFSENEGIGIFGKDKRGKNEQYQGKRTRNKPSMASKRLLKRQSNHAQRSIRQNERRNKANLRSRHKKQRKQARFSKIKTFRY